MFVVQERTGTNWVDVTVGSAILSNRSSTLAAARTIRDALPPGVYRIVRRATVERVIE